VAIQNSQQLISQPSQLTKDEEGGLELGKVLATLKRRLPLIAGVTTVVVAASLLKAMTEKPIYSGGFEILTESVTIENEVVSSLPGTLTSRQQPDDGPAIDATKMRVLMSPSVLEPVVAALKTENPEFDYSTLMQGLLVQASANGNNILQVNYTHPDPKFVERVLDLVAQNYLSYSLEDRQKDIKQGINFVENQLPQLQQQVSGLQEQLQQFRQRYNLINPETQAQQLAAQRSELTIALIKTQTELNETQLLYAELRQGLAGQSFELAGSSSLINSPRFQKLLDQLLAVDSQLAQDSTLYLEGSPELDVLQEQRQNLIPLLQREGLRVERQVASQIQELGNRNQSLSTAIAAINEQIKQLSVITRQYNEIQQQLTIATENLSQFLAKREGLRIEAAQRQIPWRLLTEPGEPTPSATSMKRTLALGTILGLLLGTGIALAVDQLSSLVRTTKDVKDITKLPVLGIIPSHKKLEEQENTLYTMLLAQGLAFGAMDSGLDQMLSPSFLEAFRSLYVNLRLVNPDTSLQSIAISSAIPDSGKTTVALYLARAAAAIGQKVLLIDTDLRRPNLHNRLQLPGQIGLTNVVANTVSFDQAVQKVAPDSNLFFLAAGSIPPDPTRILASEALQQLIEQNKKDFDLVIYDTSPLLGVADTYLLASQMDGLLLVTRLNQVKRSLLEQAMEDLSIASVPLLGTVVNDAQEQLPVAYTYYHRS
jgi:polysaccharide biosynthesis transport protein